MIRVRVPATTANMGPAFDCMGAALRLYNFIEVEEVDNGLHIMQDGMYARHVPTDERNLVYRAMTKVFDETGIYPKGLSMRIVSNIPSTRGLGTSAACIAGGMVAANALYGKLGMQDLLQLACKEEGHPDNVVPCLLGGVTVSVWDGDKVTYVKAKLPKELRIAVISPYFTLQTKKARKALPPFVSHEDAVFNESHSALLAASLLSGKLENLKVAMSDRLHQPYRKELIPHMNGIFNVCEKNGALGCYLSGAGPSLAAFLDTDYQRFEKNVRNYLKTLDEKWSVRILEVDNNGIFVRKQ